MPQSLIPMIRTSTSTPYTRPAVEPFHRTLKILSGSPILLVATFVSKYGALVEPLDPKP